MPTGSGKSLCYQLPALVGDDLAIVVSPLVALMQDQVEALHARGRGDVALVNSQQDAGTNRAAVDAALAGSLRLLYVAPERFSSPGFVDRIRDASVGLFVVDEAHCVSQWGHDFRPDYFRLADAARYVGARSLMASTATATPQVAADVVRRLGLRDPLRVTTGFDRPNLTFSVARPAPHEKRPLIVQALSDPDARPGDRLRGHARGVRGAGTGAGGARPESRTAAYHAGLPREERAQVQRRVPRRRDRGDRRHERVRDGRGQAERQDGRARQRPGVARGLLPGGGARGARRPAGARAADGGESRQGPARALHQARRADRGDARAGRPGDRATTRTGTLATSSTPGGSRRSPASATSNCGPCSGTSPGRA